MVRWSLAVTGAVLVAGTAFVTGSSIPPKPPAAPAPTEVVKATVVGHKIGVFNMAAVMREYKRAKNQVKDLNDQRLRMSSDLLKWRDRHMQLQQEIQQEKNPKTKEDMQKEMIQLARKMEDKDREINKALNDRATEIIGQLYDDIRATTVKIAREHGLVVIFAYPDAVTPEEMESVMVKELKLKPPAAQPFFVDPSVDYTGELIERLNTRYAAGNDGE